MIKRSFYIILFIIVIPLFSIRGQGSNDGLKDLRTSKKVVPVGSIPKNQFGIQILALKLPPSDPAFFSNVELAYEYACNDGFVRYVVGPYNTYEDAKSDLGRMRVLGYKGCFVVNVKSYQLKENLNNSYRFDETGKLPPDPNSIYTIQLAAFRYPVYVSHFSQFDNVMEFYSKDKIYRYCVGKYKGDEALENLTRVRSMGYPQAYLVLLEDYLPFQIE